MVPRRTEDAKSVKYETKRESMSTSGALFSTASLREGAPGITRVSTEITDVDTILMSCFFSETDTGAVEAGEDFEWKNELRCA